MKFCPPRNFGLATPLSKNHQFKSIIDFFLVVYRFRCNKMGIPANQPFHHFWQTIAFCHFCKGPGFNFGTGPRLDSQRPCDSLPIILSFKLNSVTKCFQNTFVTILRNSTSFINTILDKNTGISFIYFTFRLNWEKKTLHHICLG